MFDAEEYGLPQSTGQHDPYEYAEHLYSQIQEAKGNPLLASLVKLLEEHYTKFFTDFLKEK